MRTIIIFFWNLSLTFAASEKVTVHLSGHVKHHGEYAIEKRVETNLDDLIVMAGGFNPLTGFEHETTSSVAWIERDSPDAIDQHIIIDYKNRQILSQRVIGNKWRLERYDWDTFEYLPGDDLFIATSRKSLDLAGVPIKYVEPDGWTAFETLNYVHTSDEETLAIDNAKSAEFIARCRKLLLEYAVAAKNGRAILFLHNPEEGRYLAERIPQYAPQYLQIYDEYEYAYILVQNSHAFDGNTRAKTVTPQEYWKDRLEKLTTKRNSSLRE